MEGISSVVIHAGFTTKTLEYLRNSGRIMGMVSKGGAFTAAWMLSNKLENPFLTRFDDICRLLADKDVVLSLGNTMRSGCSHDRMDRSQREEMRLNAMLAQRANEHGIQVIIEGMGGHVDPLNIPKYIRKYKRTTGYRPLFVAGPLPAEVGVGHDHIAGCVGGTLAAGAGADYLCSITPSEHLALPTVQQVREGVVAFRIAAHIGDIMKYGLRTEDGLISRARRVRDWEAQFSHAIDKDRAQEIHGETSGKTCTMCGRFCAIALMEQYLA